ncbi:hypothetical protein Agub_g10657, partial [Astrephomene gubernaculifera]
GGSGRGGGGGGGGGSGGAGGGGTQGGGGGGGRCSSSLLEPLSTSPTEPHPPPPPGRSHHLHNHLRRGHLDTTPAPPSLVPPSSAPPSSAPPSSAAASAAAAAAAAATAAGTITPSTTSTTSTPASPWSPAPPPPAGHPPSSPRTAHLAAAASAISTATTPTPVTPTTPTSSAVSPSVPIPPTTPPPPPPPTQLPLTPNCSTGVNDATRSSSSTAPTPPVARPRLGGGGIRLAVGSVLDVGVWDSEGDWRPTTDPAGHSELELAVPPHLQRIGCEEVVKVRELGRGCFGSVWLARWRGVEVALKELLHLGATDSWGGAPGEAFSEAERLASLRHPCILAFYGVLLGAGCCGTVVEYMRGGSLRGGLSRLRKQGIEISGRLRVAIALQAARGMEYLHSQSVVHFDLKADNLLCDLRDPGRPVVKIGDLGLSKKKKDSFVSGNMRGTLPWMAPELFPAVRERQRQQQ